jgi:hypothetical protein
VFGSKGPCRVPSPFHLLLVVMLATLCPGAVQGGSPKKAPPDYGGPKPSKAKRAALWAPRVVLFPAWVVSEYGLRRPLGLLVRTAESNQWPQKAIALFTFGERNQITLFPAALFDFGLMPSVGFNLRWKYFLAEPNTLSIHAGTWGPDWVAIKVRDEYALAAARSIQLQATLVHRKDLPFYGIGPRTPSDSRFRYQALTCEVALGHSYRFWRASELSTRIGVRTLAFGEASCCGEPSIAQGIERGAIPKPPGYGQGYVAEFQGIQLAVDSRRSEPDPGSGVRLEAHGESLIAPAEASGSARRMWLRYGGSAGASLDVANGRVFGLGISGDFSDPLLGEVPFVDQVSLGGNRPMRGFVQGRLLDRSSIVATARYTWPVWIFLNGVVQADVGNVFGERLSGFALELMRMSAGIGVRSNGSPDSGFELLVAGATDPFEHRLHISSFRLVVGSHHGF